ncbi:uncharacterized protein LOC128630844 isoform X1 [Ictalurus punctatus]|uniref:Uncharacterized protein LOC128630844 isoform X1 n=1 Tax=Ictalurus punctatus TaxID=7998 RepID=A0A9F7R2C7_ICTPU|nr:uncharacterized protein LOC128630844 isoform X1 [Ictalurus punctatus]XP_053535120.1 uncharacterized protein LOC128630844 isoform X1 [Ictalurus punctatus]XP_053535121.1 uncharacterized protein LOC128630844 isoform X1 [Ictalurus punctatus]
MNSNMSVSGEQDLKRDERMMEGKRSDSPEPSCVSMKSDRSMDHPFDFRDRADSPDVRPQQKTSNLSRNQLDSIFKGLEHKVITLIKNELKRFRKLLSPDYPACTEREVEDEEDLHSVSQGALKITLHVLKNMNHTDLANTLHNKSLLLCAGRSLDLKQLQMVACLSKAQADPPPLQPLQQCWQHYFPKTTSGYDAEHVHSTSSLVDHGEACSEWNLSC